MFGFPSQTSRCKTNNNPKKTKTKTFYICAAVKTTFDLSSHMLAD